MWTRFKRWFHQWGAPPIFVRRMDAMMPWLFGMGVLGLVVGWSWGLFWAPVDYQQGNSYRIIFLHVPAASLAMGAYALMAINAVVGLVWNIKVCFSVMRAIAPLGLAFAVICLVSGSLWGKPTWGTYWVWDMRLTSMLIFAFLYAGFIGLDSALGRNKAGDTVCALLAIVGVVMLPIIKYSVEWWATLHQGSTFKVVGESSMDISMLVPFLISMFGAYCWFGAMVCWYSKWKVIHSQARSSWLRDYWASP